MKVLGLRQVSLDRVRLPGDMQERVKLARIWERAKSIARIGVLSEPGLRVMGHSYTLLYGRDRVAAAMRAGECRMIFKLYECSDAEAKEIEISENCHRRHDPELARAELAKVISLYEEQIEQDPSLAPLATSLRGRAQTARGIARRRVADERGVKLDSVRKAEYRGTRLNNAHTKEVAYKAERQKPEITTIGMEVTEDFAIQSNTIRWRLNSAAKYMQRVLSELTAIKDAQLPFPPAKLQHLYDEVQLVSAMVRAASPAALCPYCKGLPGVQEACAGCQDAGWITSDQCAHVPKQLWQEGDLAMVAYRGRVVSLPELLDTPQAPAAPPIRDGDVEDLFT